MKNNIIRSLTMEHYVWKVVETFNGQPFKTSEIRQLMPEYNIDYIGQTTLVLRYFYANKLLSRIANGIYQTTTLKPTII